MSAKIEQIIYDVIELSKVSKVPFLLMSNPGYGKTTIINKWAKENGYHVEVLIGSRFTPEEIMGYQVNEPGATSLVHKNPKWYDTVMEYEAKGIPTLLFEDEISTCPDYVQGALLDLNFSRKIGSGKELPEDCLVLAAANYADNLPSSMNIITPSLNRFCLINLLENSTNLDILEEFLGEHKDAISHRRIAFTEEEKNDFMKNFKEAFTDLVIKYSDPDSSLGYLDFSHSDMGSLYSESENAVYNIMTGRTLSYLSRVTAAMAECSINSPDICYQVGAGLVGNGTNCFSSDEQRTCFRNIVRDTLISLVGKFSTISDEQKIDLSGSISEIIQRILLETQKATASQLYYEKNLKEVIQKVSSQYGNILEVTKRLKNLKEDERAVAYAQYTSDMDSIEELFHALEPSQNFREIIQLLKKVHMSCLSFYCDFNGISLDEVNISEKYGTDVPTAFNEIKVATLTDGSMATLARRKRGDREVYFKINLDAISSLSDINISNIISKDHISSIVSFDEI